VTKSLLTLVFLTSLFACATVAQPQQRIIIGFAQTLSVDEQAALKKDVESLLKQPLQLVKPSTDQRWVVSLNPPLSPEQLDNAINNIKALPHVRYAETDSLMHTN